MSILKNSIEREVLIVYEKPMIIHIDKTELQKAKLLCGSGCRCECEGVTDATGDTCTCKPD